MKRGHSTKTESILNFYKYSPTDGQSWLDDVGVRFPQSPQIIRRVYETSTSDKSYRKRCIRGSISHSEHSCDYVHCIRKKYIDMWESSGFPIICLFRRRVVYRLRTPKMQNDAGVVNWRWLQKSGAEFPEVLGSGGLRATPDSFFNIMLGRVNKCQKH